MLAFPTAELAFAIQHRSHGGTISALLLYAVDSAAMPVFHAVTAEGLKSRQVAGPDSQ